ncbi:MAG UNVERIFIED_CONTAM: hypothetical protein LVR18_30690 [Planctomycetaceae bacterium]
MSFRLARVVCEVETDKAAADITCPHAGRVTKVLMQSGQTVSIGTPILLIEAESATTAPARLLKRQPLRPPSHLHCSRPERPLHRQLPRQQQPRCLYRVSASGGVRGCHQGRYRAGQR